MELGHDGWCDVLAKPVSSTRRHPGYRLCHTCRRRSACHRAANCRPRRLREARRPGSFWALVVYGSGGPGHRIDGYGSSPGGSSRRGGFFRQLAAGQSTNV